MSVCGVLHFVTLIQNRLPRLRCDRRDGIHGVGEGGVVLDDPVCHLMLLGELLVGFR